MHKLRTALLLLLVMAVILGCGALPQIAGAIADGVNQKAPGSAPMGAISFTPSVPETDTMQYYLDRLALHGNMYSIPVKAEVATMTEEAALTAATVQIRAYESFGILLPFIDGSVDIEPHFAIDIDNVENTAVYWTVYAKINTKPVDSLLIYLDDATGKIISIDFESTDGLFEECTVDERWELIDRLAMTFMGQFAPENDTLASRIYEVNEVEFSKNSTSYEYTLSGPEENQTKYVTIRVILYNRGFQITCTSE